jgi:hypothetical protein
VLFFCTIDDGAIAGCGDVYKRIFLDDTKKKIPFDSLVFALIVDCCNSGTVVCFSEEGVTAGLTIPNWD